MRTSFVPLALSVGALGLCATGVGAQVMSEDLTTLFEPGRLVLDTNGDSVPDFVGASLVLGERPSPAEVAAAAEIAARLGFETMAMDLPVARGPGGGIPIVIGGGAVAGGIPPGGDGQAIEPATLLPGEGVVAVREVEGRPRVYVVGGDDDGLLAAARLFAGVLPHTRSLSTASLSTVVAAIEARLESGNVEEGVLRPTSAFARSGGSGVSRLVLELSTGAVAEAVAALEQLSDSIAASPDDSPLSFPGLDAIEVSVVGGPSILFEGTSEAEAPGPIAARPGTEAKGEMDLSSLYTGAGLLGGSPFPSRVDAVLVPGASGSGLLPDLAARLGLESVGLTVPIARAPETISNPEAEPTLVLTGLGNALTDQLVDSGRVEVEGLAPGEGLIRILPDAFGSKPALVVTGGDVEGADRALEQVAITLPNLGERGKDRPTIDSVEQEVWDALAGYAPIGQAAIGLYKLDRIAERLAGVALVSADVLISVEKADAGLGAYVEGRAARGLGLRPGAVSVTVDDRDVERASTVFEEIVDLPSEVERFRDLVRTQLLPRVAGGVPVQLEARLSEPPELRAELEDETRRLLLDAGADDAGTEVVVLSAFKQGYSWLYEVVRPQLEGKPIGEIVVRFRRNEPPEAWPQQAMHTPVRWLHEIFPIDEIFARELNIELERIRFEETREGPTYEVRVTDREGSEILSDAFDPKWVLRPYFDRFRDYEQVRVTTGWLTARSGDATLVDERIPTDPETFWDYYQAEVLGRVYDHVMERHEGIPRGGSIDAPFFGELEVDLEMSEPNYRLDLDNELHAPMDALHEEIYFGTLEFFDLLGRNSRGQGLTYPGRVLPVMRPRSDGAAPSGRVRFSGFATSRPAVVVRYRDASGGEGTIRLDIPKTTLARPSARMAKVSAGRSGIEHLALRVKVDTELDVRDSLLTYATPEQVDRTMVSAQQVVLSLREMESLRAAGLYTSELAFAELGSIEVWAEWSHRENPESRAVATLAANGTPDPTPDWRTLLPEGWSYTGERLVQWDTPMPPDEGHEVLAKMAAAFPEATMYRVGRSYLGQDVWAMDLMPPISATHWSHAKASTFKPTVVYSAREHANEVSSTSHVLRHAELLLTDAEERAKLERVNVVIHPFTNPDGARLAYDLYRLTPDFILHAGYQAALGMGAPSDEGADHPIYPEAPIRKRLWETWLPDIFLNPHGYPSRQLVQLFSEYAGLVRRGRVTERNWGFNKGWFMPGFDYVDDPDFPRHKDAAFALREYMTRGINSNPDVVAMNERAYSRYDRYGARFDPEVFRLPLTDGVMIEMPLKGSSGSGNGNGYDPEVTIWSGVAESPDETAYGPWLELVAKAGLSWDRAVLEYLNDGRHAVKRSGSTFFGGVSLRMERPRPPEQNAEIGSDIGSGSDPSP